MRQFGSGRDPPSKKMSMPATGTACGSDEVAAKVSSRRARKSSLQRIRRVARRNALEQEWKASFDDSGMKSCPGRTDHQVGASLPQAEFRSPNKFCNKCCDAATRRGLKRTRQPLVGMSVCVHVYVYEVGPPD